MNHQTRSTVLVAFAASGVLLAVTQGLANPIGTDDFVEPNSAKAFGIADGWLRPGTAAQSALTLTTSQEWDRFDFADTRHSDPDVHDANGNGEAFANNVGGAGFLAGGLSANIYSPSASIRPSIGVPLENLGDDYRTRIVVQVKTDGSALVTDQLRVDFTPGVPNDSVLISSLVDYKHDVLFQFDYQFEVPGETLVEQSTTARHLWTFTLPGNPGSVEIDFGSWAPSTSWQDARVDTAAVPVPEPSGIVMLAGAAVGLLQRRKR